MESDMALTTAQVQAAYRYIRAAIPFAAVTVRHGGHEYSGTRAQPRTLDGSDDTTGVRATNDAAVRLDESELLKPDAADGDAIDVRLAGSTTWTRHTIKTITPERNGTTVWEYGAEYA